MHAVIIARSSVQLANAIDACVALKLQPVNVTIVVAKKYSKVHDCSTMESMAQKFGSKVRFLPFGTPELHRFLGRSFVFSGLKKTSEWLDFAVLFFILRFFKKYFHACYVVGYPSLLSLLNVDGSVKRVAIDGGSSSLFYKNKFRGTRIDIACSFYPGAMTSLPGDKKIFCDKPFLKRCVEEKKTNENLLLYVSSNKYGKRELDVFYNDSLGTARKMAPSGFLYYPRTNEPEDSVVRMSKKFGFEWIEPSFPIEWFVAVEMEELPGTIVTTVSTTTITLAMILPDSKHVCVDCEGVGADVSPVYASQTRQRIIASNKKLSKMMGLNVEFVSPFAGALWKG